MGGQGKVFIVYKRGDLIHFGIVVPSSMGRFEERLICLVGYDQQFSKHYQRQDMISRSFCTVPDPSVTQRGLGEREVNVLFAVKRQPILLFQTCNKFSSARSY